MAKRLEVDYIDISDVSFAEKTELIGSHLFINKEEMMAQVDLSPFETAEFYIVSPGDKVRILGLTDCTQPRVKADDPDATYPGFLGKLKPAGDGRTVALRGVLVSELYPLKANFKGLLDMSGPIADIAFLSRHVHIILDVRPKKGISADSYAQAQKLAALKISVWLAKLGIGREPDEVAVYELSPVNPAMKLPKVAYITSQWAGFDVQQFFIYGQSGIGTLPFVLHPNELLDGAFIYRYMNVSTQYYFQEEPIIKELMSRHGKDLEFVGMVMTCGKTENAAKNVSSMMAVEFARDYLKADITLNTQCGMGHCQLEQQMIHIWSEDMGMKAVTVMSRVSSEKPGDLLIISDPRVDAVVHTGDVKTMTYPHMDRLIGVEDIPALAAFDLHGPFTITTNVNLAGGNSKQGANYMTEDLNLKTKGWRMPVYEG